jgi:hypothetical protein
MNKKCQVVVDPPNSFKTRKCGKKAVLYLKDISDKPFGLSELYLCGEHAGKLVKGFLRRNERKV